MFKEIYIIGPVVAIFYLDKGLSFTDIMLLQSACWISSFIFEVPSGAFADKFGRKLSILIGVLLQIISLLIFVFGNNYFEFLIGEMIFGVGIALISGADSAMIYDYLLEQKRENEFNKIQGHAMFLQFMLGAFANIVAGFCYKFSPELPYLIATGNVILGGLFISFFKEVRNYKKDGKHSIKQYSEQIKDGFLYILTHKKLRALTIFTFCFFAFYRSSHWFYQPYMQTTDVPVEYFGLFYAGMNLVAAISSKYNSLFLKITKGKTLVSLSLVFSLTYIFMGIVGRQWGMAASYVQQVIRGVQGPIIEKYINKHAPSNKRATIISFNALSGSISSAIIINPLMGILMDRIGVFKTQITMGIAMLITTIFLNWYLKKVLQNKDLQNNGEENNINGGNAYDY
jgi:MFS family permease